MAKYKPVKFPIEAYQGFLNKKNVMEKMLKEDLHKNNIKLNFTDALRFLSHKQIYIYNDEVVNFFKNKKNKRGMRLI